MVSPPTLAEALVACLTITLGATLQGSIGFGLALVAAPMLVMINPIFVPGPTMVAALVLALMMSYREREALDVHGLTWAIVGRVVGSVGGAALLKVLPGDMISVAIGGMVLFAVALSSVGLRVRVSAKSLVGAGLLSGFMGTTSAIGGPPMALIYQHSPGPTMRAMLSGFFVIGTVISIALLTVFGQFGLAHVKAGLMLLPGVGAGLALSASARRLLDRGTIRPTVLVVSAAAAIVAILRSVA